MKLLNISNKVLDDIVAICTDLSAVGKSSNIDFMIVGATARDFVLEHGFDIPIQRATRDIDIGVLVNDWDQYELFRQELLKSNRFKDDRQQQRLYHANGLPVDILPFGGLEKDHKISWPETPHIVLNIQGFQEAFNSSWRVRISEQPVVDVQVVSPAGLAVLKLLAWNNDPSGRRKDASDLDVILKYYSETLDQETYYAEVDAIVSQQGIIEEYENLSCRLLGRDIARLCTNQTRDTILEILVRETNPDGNLQLITAMVSRAMGETADFESYIELLSSLKNGVQDPVD